MENNKMINLKSLIDNFFNNDNNVYIPLIQRNYKWDEKTAAKLATDLWDTFSPDNENQYTIGMITLFLERNQGKERKTQLIDGQQRIITLTLLLKYLKSQGEYFKFSFERDEGTSDDSRSTYLQQLGNSKVESEDMYTDITRFQNNFDQIKKVLKEKVDFEEKKNEFKNFILNSVYILLHITEFEPIDEFLNINKNKTRFVISDHIKANLIIDIQENESSHSRHAIIKLFQGLSHHLFGNDDVWGLIGKGYRECQLPKENEEREPKKCYTDENRLKVLFCDRYEGDSKSGYETKLEFQRLKFYNETLEKLTSDIKNSNWNSYNGFNCLHKLNGTRFFAMFGKDPNNKVLDKSLETTKIEDPSKLLESTIIEEVKGLSQYGKSCFIESQLFCSKDDLSIIKDIKDKFIFENKKDWIYTAEDEWDSFEKYYNAYIEEKGGDKDVQHNGENNIENAAYRIR